MGDTLAKTWVFAAATAFFVVFALTILPAKAADAALYTPPGASFDTSLFYTPEQAVDRALSYGEAGRAAYIYDRWTFDLAFPLVYGFFMLSAWAFSFKRMAAGAIRAKPNYVWLLVPALGVVFDLAENSAVTLLMLGIGSSQSNAVLSAAAQGGSPWIGLAAYASSASTALKWLFVAAGFSGALVLPIVAGIVALARRSRRGTPR